MAQGTEGRGSCRTAAESSKSSAAQRRRPTRRRGLWWLRLSLFLVVLVLVLVPVSRVLQLKAVEQNYYSAISTCSGFYNMEKDTVDVLFLGSSHAYCGFSPQELYDHAGIRSYNLGSSQQSVLMSYYWLKEALRFQHPKAVVLETFYTRFCLGNEGSIRKSFDYMRWSGVKWQAMRDLLHYDPEELSVTALLFPLNRYHSRWTELEEDDFSYGKLAGHSELKGYSPVDYAYGKDNQARIDETLPQESSGVSAADPDHRYPEIDPVSLVYLDRMADLCREKGIRLILVKTPCNENNWNTACWESLAEYARDQRIDYLDYNTDSLKKRIHYHFPTDNADSMHCSISGADKVTDDLGDYLEGTCGIRPVTDSQWEDTRAYVAEVRKDAALSSVKDDTFLTAIREDPRYVIFISRKSDTENVIQVRAQGEMLCQEQVPGGEGAPAAAAEGTFREGRSRYEISSSMDAASIRIDGTEYSPDEEGYNVVVYSLTSCSVIDVRTVAKDL